MSSLQQKNTIQPEKKTVRKCLNCVRRPDEKQKRNNSDSEEGSQNEQKEQCEERKRNV